MNKKKKKDPYKETTYNKNQMQHLNESNNVTHPT